MTVKTRPVSRAMPALASRLPQASGSPSATPWRLFRVIDRRSVRLGAGQTAESIGVTVSRRYGLAYASAWTAAAPVVFPAEVVEATTAKIVV